MSWFDKAMANAGVDKREDYGQQAIEREQNAKQEQASNSIFSRIGSNIQNAYDTSPMYQDFRGFGEAWDKDTTENINNRAKQFDTDTYGGSIASSANRTVASIVGGAADMLGMEKLGDRMNAIAKAYQDDKAIEPELSWNYITSPHGLTRSVTEAATSSATLAPTMALLPESAALSIAARLGGNKGVQFLVNNGYNTLAKRFAQTLPWGVRGATMAFPESLVEGGGTVRTSKEAGLDDPYGRGWKTVAENLPGLILSDFLGGMVLGGGALRPKQGAGALRRATTVPLTMGAEGLKNSGEEAYQQVIQNLNTDRPLMEGVESAAKEGFVGGLLPGMGSGIATATNTDRWVNPQETPEYKAWQAGAIPQQDYSGFTNGAFYNDYLERAKAVLNQQNQPIDTEPTAQPAMSVEQAQSRISAPTISAENSLDGFDNRYVSKWESKPGATDLANVQQSVKNRFNAMMAEYGDSVILTGGAETGGYHQGGGYGHEGGWKLDVDINSVKDKEKFLALCKKYGFAVGDESDKGHYDLSGHRNGGVGGKQIVTPDSFISDGGQATSGIGKREGHANAWAAYDVFRKAGYNDEAIAGILGRVQQEHNFDTSNVEEYDDAETGLHLGGYGMFQWNGGRTTAFLNWAQENNLDPQNPTVQAQYAVIEAQQRGLTPERMNQLSAEDAADVWTKEWEVGVAGSERQYAAEWRDRIKNGGSAGGSTDIESPKTKIDTSDDKLFDEYNKQLDELAEKGIEAPFKSQKELVQEAKNAAIEAGDMDEVQRINSAERSGNTEELAKIADKALKAKQKEVKGKPAPATPEIKMASPNLVKKVTELLNTAKEQGVPLRDTLVQNTLNDGSEETMQNFAGMLQSMINAHGYEQRKDQGKQLLDYADENQVDLKPGLRKMLREGQPKAIEAAQNIINEAQPTISNQEQVQPQPAQTPVQEQPIQNQQLTLQDRVNQVRGNEPGTPVSGVRVSELASIINNAGSQQQAPSKETKQVEPTPTVEAAPADEDYHGFFDDKKAGAVREAKKRLEEKINPFGNAEGFRTVKSIMERWAEADESNQSNTKGRSYYVHGNKVSKAAYDYYNHMFKNSEKEVQAESAPKQETTAAKEEKYPELTKSNREQWENIAKNASPVMMKMYGESAVENAEKEGVKIDENLAKDAKDGNPKAIAYVHQLVEKHTYENFDKLPKSEPKSTEIDPVKAHDNLKQLYKDITGKKQLGSNWASTALRKAVELGYTLSEDEKAIVSPEGKRYELSGKAIEEFRLRQRDAEDNERANVDKYGDKSVQTSDGHMAWIESHPFKYDDSLSVEKNIERAEKLAKEYMDKFGSTDQINTPERQELRSKIMNELYNKNIDKRQKGHEAFLIVGLPASGKSTISDPLVEEKGALLVDSDEAKKRLPEFSNGLLATAVHNESDNIATALLRLAIASGDNVVMPVVGRTYNGLEEKVHKFKEAGYTVKLIYVDLPMDKAIERVKNRFKEEGRLVSPDYLKSVGLKPRENYDKLKVTKEVDSYEAWNNDVPRGANPLSIESSSQSEYRQDSSGMGRRGNESRPVHGSNGHGNSTAEAEVTDHSKKGGLSATNERIFKDTKTADEEMFEALGLNDEAFDDIEVKGVTNIDDEIDNLTKELTRELSKLNANPVFNPRVYTVGLKLAILLTKKGYNNVKKLVAELNARFGKDIEPWSESIIETVRTWPKGVPFDERQVMVVSQAIGARYEDGITSLDDVQADMKKKLKKHHARFAPMIEASYNGISKFFESRKEGVSNETDSGRTGDESKRSERTETVPAGTERGAESVSERERGSEGTDRGLETSPAENGQEVSENGNPEGVRAGVSGETGRQSNAPQGRADGHVGRESGSESESSPMGRGGRQSSREGSSGSSRVGGVREETSSPLTNAENYHIDDMNALFGGTPKVRFARNRKAIEVFQDLQATKRVPTQEEKDAMAAYTGWGSFGQQLFQGTYENPKPAKGWEEESEWLRDTLGKEDWESAKDSIINAHYTAPVIVKAMWDMARRMGFKNGRVLEPSMGVGNFFGLMPKDMEQGSSLFGVEMDNTTGGMAKMLYPQANIQIKPYQDVHVADGTYDLIVGNVPFGDIAPADRRYDKFRPNLHDYFFLKGIDELRSGGIMMAITSKGTMDKMNRGVRMELAKKAELVDAYRFPTGAFGEYAGTDVVTDVLIFKKREEPIMDVSSEDWIGTTEHKSDKYDYNNHEYYTYRVNNFFENHPEKVLGTMGFGRSTGKRPGLMVTMNPETFQKQLDDMVKHVAKDAYEEAHYDKNLQYVSNNENDRIGTLQEVDGKLYVATGVDSKPIEAFKEWSLGGNITSTKTINERLEELKDLVKLRKAYAKLEDAEKNDSPDMEKLRKQLKSVYDAHVAKYCTDKNGKPQTVTYTDYDENGNKVKKKRPKLLEDTAGLKLFKKADEPNYFSLCALQRKDGKPAKILTERVMRTSKKDIENPTLQEALMIQRNQSMRIDIDEIAKMAKKSKEEVISGLREYLFKTPNGDYQVKDQYLSGNVRRKLREAQNAYANGDKDMKHNIEALQKVMPEDIPYYNISVSFGGTWIDLPYYKQFIAELVGTNNTDKIDITRDKSGSWRVRFEDSSLNGTAGATTTYGTPDVKFDRLLTHALNHTKPTINRTDPDGTRYKDEAAIEKAVEQMDKIRETFADWVWQEEKRKVALAHNYNEIMNNTARPTYDGSFLDMAGMMLTKGDKEFNLRKHQINAIYRGLVNGSGIYAHEVGTGKTYTMGGLAMESRRFGVAKKPLILAHNANSQTVANDIQAMYPGAKVLYIAGDTKNVKKDLMRVKMDDWDVIVMPHSKTNLLTLKTETLDAMAADIIAELEDDAMEAAKADGVDLSKYDLDDEKDIKKIRSQTAKDLVKQRLRIKEQIRKYAFKASDKEAIPFEDLGIDMIIVDESHDYKKPPFSTKMSVKGLQKGVSGASVQLSFLTQYVQGLNNGKGVHLFTGTPITNTITEMYHNMRYVMPNEMKEAGVYNFDDWFNAFANVTSNMEYTSTGEVDNVDRLNAFVNVAELRRMVGQYMDIVFAEDMPEFKPRETASGKTLADKDLTAEERDYLINGRDENAVGRPYMQTINEVIPMNDAQKSILSMFMGYAKDWKKANKKQRKQIMLESLPQSPLYTESSTHKAAMDARMFNPNINVSGMDSKEARVIKNVVDVYKKDKRATQVIMMDQGKSDSSVQIPRDDRGYPIAKKDAEGRTIKEEVQTYNLQKGIIDGLIKQGIPEKEIAVVTGTTSPDKKAEIANAVKHGEIRVVIGSTATLGTGVNMQDNLKAIHHIDAPWMPGDLEQRNGRILRQGNKWNTVLEYRYITEKLDGRRWQVLSTKKKFIKMFMKADDDLRILDGDAVDVSSEEEGSGGDFEETLSKATGDPRFLRKANLEETVKKLEKSRAAFVAGIEDAKFRLQKLKEGGLDELRDNVRALTAIQDKYGKYKQTHADSFEITIDGKRYTKTTDANEAIAAAFRNSDKIGKEFKLGEYAGLNLYGIKQRNTDFTASYTNRIRITDSDKTIPGFDCADSTGGINQKLAKVGGAIDREQNKLDMAESDIKTLEKQIKGTFPREAVLNAKQKELEALKQDLIDNPVPPPQWLVEGAPMQADVIVDGKRGTVESYRVIGETTFEQNEDGEVQQMTATDEEHSSFYVGVKLDGSDTVRLYPWQKVMDNQGLPMITAPEGVSESEDLKDNEVRPAETKETKTEEPAKEEKPVVKETLTTEQEAKFSMTGEMKRALNNAKVVDESDYTSQERKVAEFGKTIGTPIVWIEAAPKMHGFHVFTDMVIDGKVIPAGSTVLNRRSNMPLSQVFWHETFHWLANAKGNEAFYDTLMDYFKGKISKAQRDSFVKRNGRTDLTTDEDIIEEMLADAFEDVSQRVKIFKEMGAEQPSLARQFVAWVKRIMDKFAEFFHNPEGKLTTAQRDSFVKAFGRLARDMKDGEGRPLFKVYKEGKEIRLTNGQLVTEGVKLSAEKDIDKNRKVGDNELIKNIPTVDNLSQKAEDYYGMLLDRNSLFDDLPQNATMNDVLETMLVQLKTSINKEYKLYQQQSDSDRKQSILNVMGYQVAMLDEGRRQFNAGASIFRRVEENSSFQNARGSRRGLERDYRKRVSQIGTSHATPTGAAFDGFVDGAAELVEEIREHLRNPMRASANLNTDTTKHSEKGAFSNGETKYSYSASDNSNEGLFHKIKNIMSGKASEDSEKFRYRKHLTEMIEKALDVKLRYGKMDGKKDVVYKPENRVLRSRHAFDWENILPVAGRIAAEQLEIEPTESMNNYIADWILTGAPNNVSKEADTFHKAMREHPANSAKLEDLRDAFAEWLGKDYREQMQGTIQWRNKQKPTMQERKNKLYEEFVEELEPINRMVKQVNANLTEKGQKKLGITADPMVAFRMLRGSYGRAMVALEGRNDGAVDALKHAFPNVDFTGFKTLYQILKSIDAFQNAEKQRDFVTYCTACHIMDMHQHNDDIRQEQQHLKNKIEKLGTSKEDEAKKEEYEADIEKLSNELMPIPAAYSKDNCQKYINDGYDKYHAAQQDLVHFSNTTAAMLADSGVISEKRFQELLTKWQNYVPLFRVFEDNEDINFGDSMKHIKGSTRDIVNPLESIIRNTAQFIQKAELNKAKCLLADVARCDASGWLLEEVDKSDSDKTTITFWENGQRKYLQTDPDIVRAVNNMGADGSHFFIKFLHAITRLARACFTMASPEFALRNVARDWQDATLYTKHGMWVNPLDIVRGFIHAWKKDDVFYEWLTQGAAQASALSLDRDYTQSTLDKLGRSYWKRLTSRDWYNALLEGLQLAGEYSEYGTRIAMYKKTKAAILKDKPNATAQELQEAMLEAAFESRDLMDFARHGKAGAEYNKITAFANASIQGWDKLYRSLDFKNDPKRATRVAAKLVLYGALPAMMIFAMYHDDDWYKDAPNWLKETHWLFKFGDTTIRIPKAADMGIRFISNAVEKGLDEAYNKHPHKAKEYFLPMWDALPGMLPTSILPIIEIQANHSFFTDRPIIPQGQDKLPAKLQYGPYTTSLAKWIGETFDIAPRSVEHFVAGYTGTLGMAIPKAIDLVSGQNQQSLSLEEMPLIRGYLYPQFKSPQSVNDYYEKLNEQTKLKNEYKLTHKRPEGFDPALLKRLENAQKQLRKISKQEKSIIDNPKWSIHDKEVMQRNIQKKRIEIAKRALGTK